MSRWKKPGAKRSPLGYMVEIRAGLYDASGDGDRSLHQSPDDVKRIAAGDNNKLLDLREEFNAMIIEVNSQLNLKDEAYGMLSVGDAMNGVFVAKTAVLDRTVKTIQAAVVKAVEQHSDGRLTMFSLTQWRESMHGPEEVQFYIEARPGWKPAPWWKFW
jgi:hypothetical protein